MYDYVSKGNLPASKHEEMKLACVLPSIKIASMCASYYESDFDALLVRLVHYVFC